MSEHECSPFLLLILVGFLFLYHLHGRTMLDVHVHQLLLYAIFGSAAVTFLEVFQRGNILMEMLRCTLTVLQGSWFWQVNLKKLTYEQEVRECCVTTLPLFLLIGFRSVLCCILLMVLSGT